MINWFKKKEEKQEEELFKSSQIELTEEDYVIIGRNKLFDKVVKFYEENKFNIDEYSNYPDDIEFTDKYLKINDKCISPFYLNTKKKKFKSALYDVFEDIDMFYIKSKGLITDYLYIVLKKDLSIEMDEFIYQIYFNKDSFFKIELRHNLILPAYSSEYDFRKDVDLETQLFLNKLFQSEPVYSYQDIGYGIEISDATGNISLYQFSTIIAQSEDSNLIENDINDLMDKIMNFSYNLTIKNLSKEDLCHIVQTKESSNKNETSSSRTSRTSSSAGDNSSMLGGAFPIVGL